MMYSHAPDEYRCPFCRIVQGGEGGGPTGSQQDDVVYRDHEVTAFVASHWWPNNPGHVLVVPSGHYENIYDLPPELGTAIQRIASRLALAYKEIYGCDGVSTRQHNEPAGNQDVWHYHLHVFPRYKDDQLYLRGKRPTSPDERRPYAEKLRQFVLEDDRACKIVTSTPQVMILMVGMPGSGKSTVAREIGQRLGYPVIDKDVIPPIR